MADLDALIESLRESQRLGFLGDRAIGEVVEHARAFCRALDGLTPSNGPRCGVIDLGAGGGVPGLVIAHDLPELAVTLLDRRATRTDHLQRIVRRLGWGDRVTVVTGDATDLVRTHAGQFDAAVARGFGPPETTLRLGARFVRPGGRVVISEPPTGDRWDQDLLDQLGVRREHGEQVAVFITP